MDRETRDKYLMAKDLFSRGEYEEAEPLLQDVADELPHYADIQHQLGVISYENGKFKKAIERFREAIRINPTYTEALINLAITYNTVGLYEEAFECFERATKDEVEAPSARLDSYMKGKLANEHKRLGLIYQDLGCVDEAIREYTQALELCPDYPDIRIAAGIALRERGDHADAIEQFRAAIDIRPTLTRAWTNMGMAYYARGDEEQAIENWVHALKLDPKDKNAQACLKLVQKGSSSDSGVRPGAIGTE